MVNGKIFWWCSHHDINGMWCCHQPTIKECHVLQCKQQDKKTNMLQVAIEDEQSINESNHSSDNKNISENNSLYDKFMEIIDTKVWQQNNHQCSNNHQLRKKALSDQNTRWTKWITFHSFGQTRNWVSNTGRASKLGELWRIKADCCVCSSHSFALSLCEAFLKTGSLYSVFSTYCHFIQIKPKTLPIIGELLSPTPIMLDTETLAWPLFYKAIWDRQSCPWTCVLHSIIESWIKLPFGIAAFIIGVNKHA